MPASVVPWPPMNLVSDSTTMSAPCSIGRSITGVATVLFDDAAARRGDAHNPPARRCPVMLPAGVADALAIDGLGVLVDQRLDRGDVVASGEPRRDSLPRQDMREQRVRGAVELRHGDDVTAVIGERRDRVSQRGLPRRGRKRADGAVHCGDATLQHLDRRIGDAAVAVARHL